MNNKSYPEDYRNMVSKSLLKSYSQQDKERLGIEPTPKSAVYAQSGWTLYRCEPAKKSEFLPVLMVPSLINKNYIMDLLPGHSLFDSIKKAGLDLFVIDWGTPEPEIGHCGFEHYVSVWLKRAIRQVKKITGASKVKLCGQCIGGLMAALYASHPDLKKDVESLFLLTAPLDFEESGLLTQWTNTEGFDFESMTAPFDAIVPAEFFHASFPLLDPKKQLSKYRTLLENFEMPGFKEIWEALDVWASDNVPFTKAAFSDLINVFYRTNALVKNQLVIAGKTVSLDNIDVKTLAIAAEQDHVFDQKAAAAIKDIKAAKNNLVQYHVLPAGHVTVVAAHPVREQSYQIINRFLAA